MKKRSLTLLLILALLASLMVIPTAAATDLSIPDESTFYQAFTGSFGQVIRLGGSAEQVFDYSVPSGGVTVIIFIRGDGGCGNTNALLTDLNTKSWATQSNIRIIAVDGNRSDEETVSEYISQYDTSGMIDEVYYNPNNNCLPFWYASLIEHEGNMDNVYNVSGSLTFPYVLLVTEDSGDKLIRSELSGITSADQLNREIYKYVDTGDAPTPIVDVKVPGNARYDYVNAVFESVNENRAENGKSALTLSAELTELAMQRAAECALYYSHERPNGEICFTVTVNGMSYSGAFTAENIAAGQRSPEAVMTSWMNSTGHKRNILSDSTQIGVGCYENNGILYWVQLFGNGTDSAPTRSYSVSRIATVQALTTRLILSLSDSSALTVKNGATVDCPKLFTVNTGWSAASTILYPDAPPPKNNGVTLASLSWSTDHLVLEGLAEGSGTLALRAYKNQKDAPTVSVTVEKGLSIRYSSKTITIGTPFQFSATGGAGGYTWRMGNTSIATVDSTGKVTGKSVGNTYLYCKDSAGSEVRCYLEVREPLSIRYSSKTITIGTPFQFSATGGSGDYSWRTGNSSVATVDSTGKVTGKNVGNTYLYCKDSAGSEVRCYLEVREPLSIRYSSKTITIGTPFQFSATGGSGGYTWRTGNTSIATVDSTGKVSGKTAGNTYLYCKDSSGTEVKCLLKVVAPLSIRYSEKIVNTGSTFQFSATGGSGGYTWRTGNSSVATVDSTGKVTGKAAGNTYLYCKDSSGTEVKCLLKVAAPLSVRYSEKTVSKGSTFQFSATGGSGTYTWRTGNSSVATVDSTGKVTGKSVGNTYLYCRDSYGNEVRCLLKIK